jgi:uncharacterized RDD family membrane protein YckC
MTDDSSADQPGPNLRKGDAPTAEPAAPAQPASIWQPLDGSTPVAPPIDPRVGAWGQPHQAGVTPQAAVAAYTSQAAVATGAPVFTLASWGHRLGAFLIDSILFGLLTFVPAIAIGLYLGLTVEEATRFFSVGRLPDNNVDTSTLYAVLIAQRLVFSLIPAYFLAGWNGQTPGKRAVGIRVMRADGKPMSLGVALQRELLGRTVALGILSLITFGLAALLNYLWPLWDQQRRTGYDALAGTRVVLAPKP